MESETLRFALLLRFERFVNGVDELAVSGRMDQNSGAPDLPVNGSSATVHLMAEVLPLKSNMGWDRLAAPGEVDRNTWASSWAANSSSTAVAEMLPLDSKTGRKGPAATLAVLNAYPRESKCEVNIVLNKGV